MAFLRLWNLVDGMWCLAGYFNEVLYSEDRNRSTASTSQMAQFHAWFTEFTLIDLPLVEP